MMTYKLNVPYMMEVVAATEGTISPFSEIFPAATLTMDNAGDWRFATIEFVHEMLPVIDVLAFAKAVKAVKDNRYVRFRVMVGAYTPVLEYDSQDRLIGVERIHKHNIDPPYFIGYFMKHLHGFLHRYMSSRIGNGYTVADLNDLDKEFEELLNDPK